MKIDIDIKAQPNDITCGPTALHAVYNYYSKPFSLDTIIDEIPMLDGGGTLGVMLGNHALKNDFNVYLYTYNLNVFDPSWFASEKVDLIEKLRAQLLVKNDERIRSASEYYIKFLQNGGEIIYTQLSPELFTHYLAQEIPLLTGLSATFLYDSMRETPETNQYDDVAGFPSGHFVVISGIDSVENKIVVADPLYKNPLAGKSIYKVGLGHLINSILLGVITYDANILVLIPKDKVDVNIYRG
ncbi:cysteine peptidase family C39 domain-containing protein [Marinigracilibium pacificum]|uniref:Peptidase-C39 like family protein n=1 Tax=Marinigracilibium pacificum TaxID=2729599 RepID=A0A848IZP0_9BACT|nr:C39 family peptidase [Marinigracilibium pacificum]NMM47459.1 peptidase-C39 like family protein [Marinigracilibium pacificum]